MPLTALNIAKIISERHQLKDSDVKIIIDETFNAIKECMMMNEKILIKEFGVFRPVLKKGRRFKLSPLTKEPGKEAFGEDHYYPQFLPCPRLKQIIRAINKQTQE